MELHPFNKKPETPKMEHLDVLYIVSQIGGCSWYRCTTPGDELNRIGYNTLMAKIEHVRKEFIEAADVIVWLRPGRDMDTEHIKFAQSLGKLAVIDFDDDLWSIDHSNPAWRGWNQNGQYHLNVLAKNFQQVDMLTTTTQELADMASKFNKNITILPNMLPDKWWPTPQPKEPKEEVWIGWAGSPTHIKDVKILAGAMESILDKYPHASFRMLGMQCPFKHDRIYESQGVNITDYPAGLSQFDISLAPVLDTRFNRGKSDLKFLESAAVGVPTVASNTITYSRTIVPGTTGFLAKNSKDWIKYISKLIENEDLRRSIGVAAREYAETRFISKNIHLWERAYGLKRGENNG